MSTTVASEFLSPTWASSSLASAYKQVALPAAALALFSKAAINVATKPVPQMLRPQIVHTAEVQRPAAAVLDQVTGGLVQGCAELPAAELADSMMLVKRTYQPGTLVRKRRHGFLKRMADKNGKNILKRRLLKGRRKLAA